MKINKALLRIKESTQALLQANADLMLLQINRQSLNERELKELSEAIDECEARFCAVAVQQSCFRAEYNQHEIMKKYDLQSPRTSGKIQQRSSKQNK